MPLPVQSRFSKATCWTNSKFACNWNLSAVLSRKGQASCISFTTPLCVCVLGGGQWGGYGEGHGSGITAGQKPCPTAQLREITVAQKANSRGWGIKEHYGATAGKLLRDSYIYIYNAWHSKGFRKGSNTICIWNELDLTPEHIEHAFNLWM